MESSDRALHPRELELIEIAQYSFSNEEAEAAMTSLREEFDPTYHWCWECDGVVTTVKDCCLTDLNKERAEKSSEDNSALPF